MATNSPCIRIRTVEGFIRTIPHAQITALESKAADDVHSGSRENCCRALPDRTGRPCSPAVYGNAATLIEQPDDQPEEREAYAKAQPVMRRGRDALR